MVGVVGRDIASELPMAPARFGDPGLDVLGGVEPNDDPKAGE